LNALIITIRLALFLSFPVDPKFLTISQFQNTKLVLVACVLILSLIGTANGGIVGISGYGICQTGCNTVWVACVSGAGGTAGVSTGGAAVPAAIVACNAAQVCISSSTETPLIVPVHALFHCP